MTAILALLEHMAWNMGQEHHHIVVKIVRPGNGVALKKQQIPPIAKIVKVENLARQ